MTNKNEAIPLEKRRGWLKNNNPPGDFMKAPRCRAKTRRGTQCQCPAMKNGRCRLHGGKSTGPKTPEGIERIRQAHLKHGKFTKEAIDTKKKFNKLIKDLNETLKEVEESSDFIKFKIHKSIDI